MVAALLQGCGYALPTDPGLPDATVVRSSLARLPAEIIRAVNAERQARGLAPLRSAEPLTQAAQLHANQMAEAERMAHDLPEALYPSLEARLAAVRYSGAWVGENLGVGYWDAGSLLRAWMASPAHRENVTSPHAVEIGAALSLSADGKPYYALVLGRPG